MDITDPHVVRTAFLNTYADPDDIHPLQQFEQYERVQAFREHNPNAGRATIGDTLDIPRGRVQGWVYDGTKPTGYEALQTVEGRGWLDLDWDSEQVTGLNELVAWIFSGGTINDGYTPVFNIEPETKSVCIEALERTGISDYSEGETNPDGGKSSPVVRVHSLQTVFGRLLVALGAPQGSKASQQYGLPCYLTVAPEDIRERFAGIYLLNRGVHYPDRGRVVIREERTVPYLESLTGFFRSLTTAGVRRDGDYQISISELVLSDIAIPKKWNGSAT